MKRSTLLISTILLFIFSACDVEKTEEGEAPELDVDVEAESGEMPEYDVDWADVNVDTRTKTITVPKVVIAQEEKEVEVPYVDVTMPDSDSEVEERNLMVEAEVHDTMHKLEIEKVYASQKNLYVVARLSSTDQNIEDETVRVSDQLVLNAPDDLNVIKYIIGDKPSGEYNNQYTYLADDDVLNNKIGDAQVIYQR
ncbi:hypothetical protein LVD15_20425 [Fulvivirga maritima]|uniref:hypothetical protein n=1 Tax=Fulvivirga maritima TaxID=2904247 RepID=UPI001F2FAB98|nr:hypothetical protein [Fulvivirga maritima]UII25649.1 hypothetical protein LVD15_20425 [Fulvivirga maritima]